MDRWTLSAHRFRQLAIVTTAGLCLLVVAGGVVRLTGSGLGCDDWPNCNAESFVDVSSGHTAIEQVNRLLSALIGIPTLAMAIGCFRVRPRRDGLVWPSLGVLFTVLGNGVVGGIAVRTDLHPALVQSHFLLAMASIAFALDRRAPRRSIGTGTGTGTGSTDHPADRLAARCAHRGCARHRHRRDRHRSARGRRGRTALGVRDLDSRSRSTAALCLAAVGAGLVAGVSCCAAVRRSVTGAGSLLSTWMFVAVVQGGIGYFQYFNGVPEMLVGAHIAGATALWVATVVLVGSIVSTLPAAAVEPVIQESGRRGIVAGIPGNA